ncbi:MAG: nucleoside triphosphate pyrophosphohydrolase [Acidimicrobiia bacterium]
MTGTITIVGLGPAGLDRIDQRVGGLLDDPRWKLIVRTLRHPAARELGQRRQLESCDDLYQASDTFDEVYQRIAHRVLAAAADGDVVYAVPGSALVGERSVGLIRELAAEAGIGVDLVRGESFLEVAIERLGLDPLEKGIQVLDGRELPYPLLLHLPTLIAQVDTPLVLLDVKDALGRVLGPGTPVTVLADLGGSDERVETKPLADLEGDDAGLRVVLFLDPPAVGWPGLVRTNRRLRHDCPWDSRQTHHSLVKHLVEEAYEAVEALSRLPEDAPGGEPDYPAYAEVEEELGDLLLQVVFHATLAAEVGAFDVEEVAEGIRRKLVRRHPHVFGEVEVEGADQVIANWERLKHEEKERASRMDDVPAALPALTRAAKVQGRAATVGFDWPDLEGVLADVGEELQELKDVLDDPDAAASELGDVLFAVVNAARRLDVDPELALRRAVDRFDRRFRTMEAEGGLEGLTLEEMDRRWEAAKAGETDA